MTEDVSLRTEFPTLPNLGIGAFYFIAAFCSLNLMTPPGYATAVWPAAGIALAMVLLYGPQLWPGLLVGATLVNLTNLYDPAVHPDIGRPLLLATSLGVAATLQALVAFYLIKPRVTLDQGLVDAGDIVRLLLIGGPVACLVSATWSVATLYLAGIIAPLNLSYNWITWWVGDAIGVMLGVPLIMIWLGRPREVWEQRKAGVAIPVFAAFAIVLVIYLVEIEDYEQKTESHFASQAQLIGDTLERKIQRNLEVVYAMQGLFDTADFVDSREFHHYASRALERNPGIHALSWNPVVTRTLRPKFESSMQDQGFRDFRFTERNAAGEIEAAADREFHVPVQYIEPLETNRFVLGYDVFSNKQRKQALRAAQATGELTGTEPITLVQEPGSQVGVLLVLPVQHYPNESKAQAAAADLPSGFVVSVMRIGSLLEESLAYSPLHHVIVRLRDVDNVSMPKMLGDYLIRPDGLTSNQDLIGPESGALYWERHLKLGNRSWMLEIQAHENYLSNTHRWTLWGIFITGLMFTLALEVFLMILSGRAIADQNRARALAAEIAERKAVERKLNSANRDLELIATTDELTGIKNRRSILEQGLRLAAEAQRYQIPYVVLMLDIDHFKLINDKWGHRTGDLVLKNFVTRVCEAARDVDDFGRWGGEEFLILTRNSKPEEVIRFAKRLVAIVADHSLEPVGQVTVSIGVAISKEGESFDKTVQRADRALYCAKDRGRNRVECDGLADIKNFPAAS